MQLPLVDVFLSEKAVSLQDISEGERLMVYTKRISLEICGDFISTLHLELGMTK